MANAVALAHLTAINVTAANISTLLTQYAHHSRSPKRIRTVPICSVRSLSYFICVTSIALLTCLTVLAVFVYAVEYVNGRLTYAGFVKLCGVAFLGINNSQR